MIRVRHAFFATLAVLAFVVAPQSGAAQTSAEHVESATAQARTISDPDPATLAVTEADLAFWHVATRVAAPPVIDGELDDDAWRSATPITEFVQSQPDEGEPATERTEVRVVFDGEAIYVAARMYDSRPDLMVATVLRRDESHDTNDAFAVTLDTYHDHRNGFFFETNAHGAKFDAQIIGEGGTQIGGRGGSQTFNRDWDAVWTAAGRKLEDGWAVEIAIPFWSLRFDREAMDAWGINFRRTIRRKTEQSYWAPVPRQFNATRLSTSGMLLGLESLVRPRNVNLKPYVRGDLGQFPSGPEGDPYASHVTDPSGTVGGDVKWSITPNLTLDATVNTDFAQVEADDVQINLTRFPLFFPEKREFFLENAGLFQFGGGGRGGPQVLGFFSRRIGIHDGGEVPILAGARLSGKSGPWNVGLLNMQTRSVDEADVPSENHGVVRFRRELGARSSVGALFTNRQSGSSRYNRAIGFDGRWAINDKATVDAWWMTTRSPESAGESDWAGQLQAQWASPTWQIEGSAMQIGDEFNPELGFVNRRDVRHFANTTIWTPYFPQSPWIRNLAPHVSFNYTSDRSGRLLSRRWHFDYDMFLKRGDKLSLAHNRTFEQLDEPFEIVPGVIIMPGAYHFDEMQLELLSDPSRAVHGGVTYAWGGFWDGDRKNLRLTAGFRVGARFNAQADLDRNDVNLTAGSFRTDLWRLRLAFDINTRFFVSGLFQYDNLTDRFLSNVRLNYIHAPLSDIFLVYNESRLTEDPTLIDRSIILKVTKLFRL